jgi:hypothetical protein
LFLFGPNTVSASGSGDFLLSVVDDPASNAALLRPADPATLGFFIRQGYNADQVFFLFIDKLVYVDKRTNQVVQSFENEPLVFLQPKDNCGSEGRLGLNCNWAGMRGFGFYTALTNLVDLGLSVEVDPTFVPSQKSDAGNAKFCFDPANNAPGFQLNGPNLTPDPTCKPGITHRSKSDQQTQTVTGALLGQKGGASANGQKNFAISAEVKSQPNEMTPALGSFPNPENPNEEIYVYTHSVYGA